VRFRKKKLVYLIAGLGLLLVLMGSFYLPISKRRLNPQPVISLRLTDRNGVLLREVLSDEGGRCRWVQLKDISPFLIQATIAAEDKQYFVHPGVNIYAVLRAFLQNLKSQHVVSGASTITQQVVRNIYHFRRNIFSKVLEAWLAVRLEHTISKEDILVQYLNRISYGNQAYGIEAASRLYFAKPSSDLSLAEAAFLAALPRSPSKLNPYRNFASAQKRQKELLRTMGRVGGVKQDTLERALTEELRFSPENEKFRAPHFCDYILEQIPADERRTYSLIQTTLDYDLQSKVETLLKSHLAALEKKGLTNAAALVLDNASGDILAMAGSRDFFDERHDGQVNGVLSLRQPGSTLKPLTYALALEKGMTAATVLDDIPTNFAASEGSFMPENYDEKYHGPIRLRSALASSYNIPAVAVLQILGPDLLYQRLKDMDFTSLRKTPDFYGVGLTLGNGEVTLLELARAYAALARQGLFMKEKTIRKFIKTDGSTIYPKDNPGQRRVFSPEVAYIITHILADKDARIPTFGYYSPLRFLFPVAAKTGTSKDFRDNWTIGYTPQYTVGIWAGNFDGQPMHNVSGMTGAGPLFRDIMLFIGGRSKNEEFQEPKNLVHSAICPISGNLPGPQCTGVIDEIFIRGTEPKTYCRLSHKKELVETAQVRMGSKVPKSGVAVAFPQDGDIFKLDPILRQNYQSIRLQVLLPDSSNVQAVEWWANGQKIGVCQTPFSLAWNLKSGSYTIKAKALMKTGAIESRPVKIIVLS
jgi:penicillin-binding protein 1C